jgi:hypothetical protein
VAITCEAAINQAPKKYRPFNSKREEATLYCDKPATHLINIGGVKFHLCGEHARDHPTAKRRHKWH